MISFSSVSAQKVAVIVPDGSDRSRMYAAGIEQDISRHFKVIDQAIGEAAFAAFSFTEPLNLTAEQSKTVGSAIGCDFFLLVESNTLRRSAFGRPEYYESYAALFLVSSRSGILAHWFLPQFEAATPTDSEKLLKERIARTANEVTDAVHLTAKSELVEPPTSRIEELPTDGATILKNFKAPIPYRRIKPEYSAAASLHNVTATVEITVDIDAAGEITRTVISRWAGFGLDESVTTAVRSMTWRPAFRDGKPLAMRVLLRYNFKKIGPKT